MRFRTYIICLTLIFSCSAVFLHREIEQDVSSQLQKFESSGKWQHLKESFMQAVSMPEMAGVDSWSEGRIEKFSSLLLVYKSLNKMIDPDFDIDATPPAMKVSAPRATSLEPGASPSLISDPKLKKSYIKSIEENKVTVEYWTNQMKYLQINNQLADYIKSYVKRSFSNEDDQSLVDTLTEKHLGLSYNTLIQSKGFQGEVNINRHR